MKRFTVVVILAAASVAVSQTPSVSPQPGPLMSTQLAAPCTVSGKVTDQLGEPLSAAKVTLRGTKRTMAEYAAVTGVDGSFIANNVVAGDYWANASRGGYASSVFGRSVNISSGQILNHCDITLKVGSSLAGRLTDQHGQPASMISVVLLQDDGKGGVFPVFAPGQLPFHHASVSGDFRFEGLEPGAYFLMTDWMSVIPAIQEDPVETVVPTFYPGATSFREAQAIHVAEGEQRTDLTFALRTVRPRRVRGRIEVPDDAGPHTAYIDVTPPEISSMAHVPPSERVRFASTRSFDFNGSFSHGPSGMDPAEEKRVRRSLQPGMPRRAPGDTFDLWILPGSYHLVASLVEHRELEARDRKSRENSYRSILATIPPDLPETDPRRMGIARILDAPYFFDAPYLDDGDGQYHADIQLDVADQDIDGLVVSFAGLTRLDGIVRFAHPWSGTIPEGTQVSLQKAGDKPEHPVSVSPNGEAALKYLAPGRYTVKVQLESENLAVESLRYNGTDIASTEIEVLPGANGKLEVIAKCDLGGLDGVVETADGSVASGVTVWLFRKSELDQPIRQTITDQVGHFEIRNIPPGEYRLHAVYPIDRSTTVRRNNQTLAAEGSPITVAPNGRAVVRLKI